MTETVLAAADAAGTAGPPERLLELSFRSIPDRLKLVRAGVRAAVQSVGFDKQSTDDIVLAVDEACANVIIHAYQRREDGEIVLTVFREGNGVRIVVRDFAPPSPPFVMERRDLDTTTPGGLGTHFIREIMDDVRLAPATDGAGNVLELTKRIAEAL